MTATKKLTAYGAVVVAALAMGFALLTAAFAAPSVGDDSHTYPGDGNHEEPFKVIDDNRGQLKGDIDDGEYKIVTQPASGGSVSVDTETQTVAVTTMVGTAKSGRAKSGTGGTINVLSTDHFPSSGYFFIDDNVRTEGVEGEDDTFAVDAVDDTEEMLTGVSIHTYDKDVEAKHRFNEGDDEIVSCTGKTKTSLTGCTRGIGHTRKVDHEGGSVVHPIKYSSTTVLGFGTDDDAVNVADSSVFAKSGRLIVLSDTEIEAFGYEGRSGSTLTTVVRDKAPQRTEMPAGSDVIQFGRTVDTATIEIDVDSGFTGSFTYEYEYAVGDDDGDEATVTVTVISDDPVANDVSGTVTATLPAPLPIILVFSGTDSSSKGAAPDGVTFTSLPTSGLLDPLQPGLTCTDVDGAKLGEVMTNCSAQTVYTPLVGASGTDTFTYTITNGDDTSAAATVTITLPDVMVPSPGDVPAPTMGEGFAGALAPGVTLTTYGGGTVAELEADASTAGATSVAVTDSGTFVVLVVGAPSFVNQAFNDLFSDGVPANTVVLVLVSS